MMDNTAANNNSIRLELLSKPDHSDFDQTSLTVTRKGATFGRKPENTHTLPDKEKIISSYHAAISLVDGKFTLTDTSTNGTMVNDNPITFPKALSNNDIITIGKYQFSVAAEPSTSTANGEPSANGKPSTASNEETPSFLDELALSHPQSDKGQSDKERPENAATNHHREGAESQKDAGVDTFDEFLAPKPITPKAEETRFRGVSDGLDQWLEPDSSAASDLEPLQQAAQSDQSLMNSEIIDPLEAMKQATEANRNTISGLIKDADHFNDTSSADDQWWLESGSHGNHSSAINQAVAPLQGKSAQANSRQTEPEQSIEAQRQPWEMEQTKLNSIDDFLADTNQSNIGQTTNPPPAHHSLNTIDSELDRWLSEGNNSGSFAPLGNSSLEHSNSEHSNLGHINPINTLAGDPVMERPQNQQLEDYERVFQPQYNEHQNSQHQNSQPQNNLSTLNPNTQNSNGQYQNSQSQNMTSAPQGHLVQALAAELGLNRLSDQELSRLVPEVSGILKETISRLLEVLIARSNIKNEMRIERTLIKTSENNPLKFSVSGEDALQNLLAPRSSAFLSGKAAITEAFDDLADHQIALLTGMREAYNDMLNKFSPEAFQEAAQSEANKGIFKGNGKAKKWDAYEEFYKTLKADQEVAYNNLFGDSFNRIYEEKIGSLKTLREQKRPM